MSAKTNVDCVMRLALDLFVYLFRFLIFLPTRLALSLCPLAVRTGAICQGSPLHRCNRRGAPGPAWVVPYPGTYEAPASLIYVAYNTYVCQSFAVSTGLMAPSSIDINPISIVRPVLIPAA